ncbi:hypothetical protein NLJ89_g12068 [Agrocybe chaxingu]|uniref:Uncharacterized protein n=1 Tax=Agrocybe chaxingu TaxID=84603 RepID=A0A9W8JVI9_9AGAR|nr:hypothetical protein NLJ89_g12068 [Agrocybe chaxingu]
MFMSSQPLPAWEVMRNDPPSVSTGSKRAHDSYNVDDFFTDMKKRRVNPSYDPRMAERLNNIAYTQNGGSNSSFNPRSVSLDIRTPEELAAVNEFLITLGRDVSGSVRPSGTSSHSSSNFSPENYFDPANLSQLGLSAMVRSMAATARTTPPALAIRPCPRAVRRHVFAHERALDELPVPTLPASHGPANNTQASPLISTVSGAHDKPSPKLEMPAQAQPMVEEPVPQMPQTYLTFLLISGKRRTMSFEPETTIGRVKELVWNSWPAGE